MLIRRRHILLVDDDISVLARLSHTLVNRHYRVTLANDGRMALELFGESGEDYSLVITDFDMPYLDGIELAVKLKERRPDIPVVLYSDKEFLRNASSFIDDFLPAPSDTDSIVNFLQDIFERIADRPAQPA